MAKTTPGSREEIRRLRKEVAALKRAAKKHAAALQQSTQALADAEAWATESLAQQTATAEILRVISSTPDDTQPVFEAIVNSTQRLMAGKSTVLLLRRDPQFVVGAYAGPAIADLPDQVLAAPLDREQNFPSRAILDAKIVHVPDWEADDVPEHERVVGRSFGIRAGLMVPLLREGQGIGALVVTRSTAGPYDEKEIALLRSFADQAVIAIENVRLFTELEARNRDLAQALEQQTATGEILRVISSSPTDVQPVFDTIVRSASELCGGQWAIAVRLDGELLHLAAQHNPRSGLASAAERLFPRRPERDLTVARAVLDGAVVHIPDVNEDAELEHGARTGHIARAFLAVPMFREGVPIGAIGVSRATPGPFAPEQIGLLKTFAAQAVIAIENVRLFTELQASNRELTTALDQQTATSDILRVISRSQTDVQPVFDAIVASAVRLLGGYTGVLTRIAGDQIELAALTSADSASGAALKALFPRPLQSEGTHAQAIRDRAPLNIADAHTDPRVPEFARAYARIRGYQSQVVMPILHHDEVIGTISVSRREPGGFTDDEIALLQTFADQAVIAIENVRLFNELEGRNRDLSATSEILRVISSSPTDAQPVFSAIAESAAHLTGAVLASVYEFDGSLIHLRVLAPTDWPHGDDLRRNFPRSPTPDFAAGRVILERAVLHGADLWNDPDTPELTRAWAREMNLRSVLWVPMFREGEPIGVIGVTRRESGFFPDEQVRLLQTFADQAVIAIENVRLFKELESRNRELTTALDQQTATSDILRVISRSQTDVQPVFDAIVASAVRLLGGYSGLLTRIAGDQIELAALTSTDDAGDGALRASFPRPLHSEAPYAQVIRDRAPVNIADAHTDPRVPEALRVVARTRDYRSWVGVPLLRHDEAVGTIGVTRREPGGFTDDEIALLKTFADQAVIAIENVRLFNELEGRNRDLTATSEILRVISSSPTDVQPVFDTIARSAVRLCGGIFGAVFRYDGELVHLVAHHNFTPGVLDLLGRMYPMRPSREQATGRAILSGAVAHLPDVVADPEYRQEVARQGGWRSMISVPMFREGATVGAIWVARAQAGPFPDNQIELLKTFADQAVIAIENVRLFKELQARTTELTRSVDQLTALGEISRAVSSTLDVETVLQTVVSRASQLAGADGCAIYEYDDATEAFHIRATHNLDPVLVGTLRASPLRKGEGAIGRAAETREPTQVADIAVPGAYRSHIRETLLSAGYRAVLSVPLLREGEVIGSLSLNRHAPGEFPPEAVEVLKTFATQSALAIQNARLFREIADKSRQLEAASRHKSEFLANMSHELRTPLNAIIGFSEVLVDRMFGQLNEKQDEYLKDIHASGQHLLSLINDILDLSKIEAGRMELELTRFDLPQAIDNALTLVRERAGRRGIALHHAVDEGLGQVTGDERKIKQVLLNLLSNALKFTPEGGRIEVRAHIANGMAEISVTDTGVGIAAEHHDAVFEEFRQVGEAEKKAEGTGLGLALCRKFVELHGGRIWVKSQIGLGSTFAFTLPLDSSP